MATILGHPPMEKSQPHRYRSEPCGNANLTYCSLDGLLTRRTVAITLNVIDSNKMETLTVIWPRCVLVALLLLVATKKPMAQDVFTAGQKTAIESIVHDYYLNHPDAFIEVMQKAQSVARAAGDTSTRMALVKRRNDIIADPRTPVVGNPHGDVTVVEFFDYRCPYCRRAHPNIAALIKDDPNVRIVYKDLPVLGPT